MGEAWDGRRMGRVEMGRTGKGRGGGRRPRTVLVPLRDSFVRKSVQLRGTTSRLTFNLT